MKAKHNLEHIIFNSWKKKSLIKNLNSSSGKIIVGVSGGRDSMVLLTALLNCFPKNQLIVVHCHHGVGGHLDFRDQADVAVTNFCKQMGIIFEQFKSDHRLSSEAECRAFRLSCFEIQCRKYNAVVVAMAHHRDDWLETQLMKLIRGSSFASLRSNFDWAQHKQRQFFIWRPLSQVGRAEIESYRVQHKISFIEDPSNQESMYFRNWIRNIWLPMLEINKAGSRKRLALSLINSIQEIKQQAVAFPWDFQKNTIDFIYFLSLSDSEKLRCLAFFVHTKGLKNIRSSQLKELTKQLDKNSDHYHIHFKTFDCLVNAGQLIMRIH